MVRRISSKIIEIRILAPETEIMKETLWSRIQGKTACTKNSWRLLAMESNGQCSRRDNCSFGHDINKRAKNDTAEFVSKFFHAAE